MACASRPSAFMDVPSAIITVTNEKLTDWMESMPDPSGPKRLTCSQVPTPEATMAMDTR